LQNLQKTATLTSFFAYTVQETSRLSTAIPKQWIWNNADQPANPGVKKCPGAAFIFPG
jgi:hypothetical protein